MYESTNVRNFFFNLPSQLYGSHHVSSRISNTLKKIRYKNYLEIARKFCKQLQTKGQ